MNNVALYTGLALFAGAGGLELGLKTALGDRYRCIAYVEREASSAAVLAKNMERPESGLDKAVIWDDVTTFTGDVISPFVDNIDIMSAGFPCQPWSVAGARKGTEDERWLWPHIFRLVREIRPRNIFLENVPGLLHGGIEHVLGDLASVGFDAQWISLRASSVSAPHRRERVFILAMDNNKSGRGQRVSKRRVNDVERGSRELASSSNLSGQVSSPSRADGTSRAAAAGSSGALGNASVEGRQGKNSIRQPKRFTEGRSELGNADHAGLQRWRRYGKCGNELPAWPPGPSDTYAWEEVLRERPDLAPAVGKSAERGLPKRNRERVSATGTRDAEFECTGGRNRQATAEPEVRGVADGVARGLARTQQLRILGNGVVPQQAALAFQILKERN